MTPTQLRKMVHSSTLITPDTAHVAPDTTVHMAPDTAHTAPTQASHLVTDKGKE